MTPLVQHLERVWRKYNPNEKALPKPVQEPAPY